MWAIKMKMSMNETPKMYQADHCNDYHNKATTRANNNLTNLIGQKTDLINNCDDGDSNGDDTSNNQNQSSLISSSCVNAAFQTVRFSFRNFLKKEHGYKLTNCIFAKLNMASNLKQS